MNEQNETKEVYSVSKKKTVYSKLTPRKIVVKSPQGEVTTLTQIMSKGPDSKNYKARELRKVSEYAKLPINIRKYPMLYEKIGGRYTRVYTRDIPERMETYFARSVGQRSKGEKIKDSETFPTWEEFGYSIGTSAAVLNRWYKEACDRQIMPDFVDAYLKSKELQVSNIRKGSMLGVYSGVTAALVIKNITDWTDRQEIEVSGGLVHSRGMDLSSLTTTQLKQLLSSPEELDKVLIPENNSEMSDIPLLGTGSTSDDELDSSDSDIEEEVQEADYTEVVPEVDFSV